MKKALTISGSVLLVFLVAAGGFWVGMRYESNRAERVRANFVNARGSENPGAFPPGGQFPDGELPSVLQFVGGTIGQVKEVDGNVMTISTAEDVTTVHLTDKSQIWKSVITDVAELEPGMRIRVTGERDRDGNISAGQIIILSDEYPMEALVNPVEPPQTEMEP